MNSKVDNKEIGKRISCLRVRAGLSQEELASSVGISRPSLTQIEHGNRNVSALELMRIADILNLSIDEVMSADFRYDTVLSDMQSEEVKPSVRISVPSFQKEKFKNLILYILEHCAGKPNVGETVLYKLLYFSDFNYYELYEEHLSGATYMKRSMGPVPVDIGNILHEMEEARELKAFRTEYFGYAQNRYMPLVAAKKKLFNGAELEVVDKVIDQLSGMTASEISNYSHGDMPWKASKDRQVMDYELAFYREAPYSVRTYNEDCDD